MINNNKGFSIIIGMALVVLITLSAYVILDYMVPYAKSTKGIENASNAYYNAYGGIELALEYIKTRPNLTSETGGTINNDDGTIGKTYSTFSSGTVIPKPGEGNSEYDKNFNIISPYEPIQLEVGNNMQQDIATFEIWFKVPKFNGDNSLTLSGGDLGVINWLLSRKNDTLFSKEEYIIKAKNILDSDKEVLNFSNHISFKKHSNHSNFYVNGKDDSLGITLSGSEITFNDFYNNNCRGTNSGCILKMSIINDLYLTNDTKIPYLEWVSDPHGSSLPDRYTTITSQGKSYMYRKDLKVKVPQQTVNQALDFTVFQ